MSTYYVYVSEDESSGPHELADLENMVEANGLTSEHYLWGDESSGWVRADTLLPQLFGGLPTSTDVQEQLVNFSSITNNPFRILGISIDASERDKLMMLKRTKAYIKVGNKVICETDFNLSVEPARGEEELEDAQSKIQQVEGRLRHAHMWFWEGNSLDKKAFENFKAGQLQEGTELLERNVAHKGVSVNNYSSVRNLGLYYLDRSTTQGSLDSRFLTVGIQNLGSFCDSEFFDEYSSVAGDKRFQISRHKLQEQIVDDIYQPLKGAIDTGAIGLKELLDAFNTFPDRLRKYLSDKFTSGPVTDVESEIEEAKRTTKGDPAKGYLAAGQLYRATKPRLATLENILDQDDFQLETLKTDVAEMMRHCSTENHNERVEDGEDPGEQGLEITKLALKVCDTGTIGKSLKEDIEILEEWNR